MKYLQFVHGPSFQSYTDDTNVDGMGQKPHPCICTSNIFHLCLGRWYCHHRHLFSNFSMSAFSCQKFDNQLYYFKLLHITSPKNEDSFLYAPASALIAFALTGVLSKLWWHHSSSTSPTWPCSVPVNWWSLQPTSSSLSYFNILPQLPQSTSGFQSIYDVK